MDIARLAWIRAGGHEAGRDGTGYLIGRRLVLTAWHTVAAHRATGTPWPLIKVRLGQSASATRLDDLPTATLAWHDDTADVALIELPAPPRLAPASPVRWGMIAGSGPARYTGLAFPRFADRAADGGPRPGVEQLGGTILPLSDDADVFLLDQDAAPDAVRPRTGPHPATEWDGASGAAVFCASSLVGVVTGLPVTHGSRRLIAVNAQRLMRDQAFVSLVSADCGKRPVAELVPRRVMDAAEAGLDGNPLRKLGPAQLFDRAGELDMLKRFCAGPDAFLWLQAPPYSGKTALVSWFVRHELPPGVEAAGFAVTRRPGEQSTREGYARSMARQLERIAGMRVQDWLGSDPAEWLEPLIAGAAKAVTERPSGGSLLLVVDGLDLDEGSSAQRIASLLPSVLPPGVRLLVTSRDLPEPAPRAGHLAHLDPAHATPGWRVLPLTPSQQATDERAELVAELRDWLSARQSAYQEIIGLLAVAGGLTANELVELVYGGPGTPDQVDEVRGSLRDMGRILVTERREPDGEQVHVFAHDTLLAIAGEELARSRSHHLRQLHAMADRCRDAGWPPWTPRFLIADYPGVLAGEKDHDRLIGLVTDAGRHDLMRMLSETDERAFDELRAAGGNVLATVASHALLAIERDRLVRRNQAIPAELPAAWAALGRTSHALTLANCIPNASRRHHALVKIVETVPGADEARDIAEKFAAPGPGHPDPDGQHALRATALAVAGGRKADVDLIAEALQAHQAISDPELGRESYRAILTAYARLTPDYAEEIVCRDEETFRRYHDAGVLPPVIEAMTERDPDRALRVALAAREMIIGDCQAPGADEATLQAAQWALDAIADALVEARPAHALEIARLTGYDLCAVKATAAEALRDPARGQALRPELGQIVTQAAARGDAGALAAVGPALAALDPARALEVARLLITARQGRSLMAHLAAPSRDGTEGGIIFVNTLTEEEAQARTLATVAAAVAPRAPGKGAELARRAQDHAARGTSLAPALVARACATAAVATAAVDAGLAWQTAQGITIPGWRAWALAGAAAAAARAGRSEAPGILRDAVTAAAALDAGATRGRVLATVAEAAARLTPDDVVGHLDGASQAYRQLRDAARGEPRDDPRARVEVLAAAARAACYAARGQSGRRKAKLEARARMLALTAITDIARASRARKDDDGDRTAELMAITAAAVAGLDPRWALKLARPVIDVTAARYPLDGAPASLYRTARVRDYMADMMPLTTASGPYEHGSTPIEMPDGRLHTPWEPDALADLALGFAASPQAAEHRDEEIWLADLAVQVARQLPEADVRAASLAAAADALAACDAGRAALLAAEASELYESGSLTAGRTAARLASAADRCGHHEIRRLAMLATRTALSGKQWIDAIPALGLLEPAGMPRVCEAVGAHAAETGSVPEADDLL